ncbi:MAG TPA: hypothetical protein PKW55_00095 [Spirochaetota bacterium]|nr:hypothetical protein [Spirochaetota bacterium]HOM37758.1 hypothetical protein [Spirochaetota bacterium]HPQ49365.1 hypothetical protein [Spirochaetota bacterium]
MANISDDERKKILEKLKQQTARKEEDTVSKLDLSYYRENKVNSDLISKRKYFLEEAHFENEDLNVIEAIQNSFKNKDYFTFFYVYTNLDYCSFIQKRFPFDIAIELKIEYLVGTRLSNSLRESRDKVLYKILEKITNNMDFYRNDYDKIETLNHLLASLSGFLFAIPYSKTLLDKNFVIGFKSNNISMTSEYCVIIPDFYVEKPEIKEVYDFYYRDIKSYFSYSSNGSIKKKEEEHIFHKREINPMNLKLESLRRKTW